MRLWIALAAILISAAAASAQRHKLTINAETPEGQLLQQIGSEEDAAKKIALLEQFASKYEKHEGMAQVCELMMETYAKAGDHDKALQAADKLLALDPADLEGAHAALKSAEAKKDADAVIKWSNATAAIARKIIATPKPSDESEAEEWKRRADFAQQVDVYSEYAIFAAALQIPDPAKKIALGQALEQRNPDSQYYQQVAEQHFMALLQAGKADDAVALANRVLAKNQTSVEMLVTAGTAAIAKEPDKAIQYGAKALEVNAQKLKPEGVDEAAWAQRNALFDSRAHWLMGRAYATQNKWAQADKSLREALPGVQNDKNMGPETLFYLGLANYHLGEAGATDRIKDAFKYNQQCAAIAGPYQQACQKNIKAIQVKYRLK